MEENSKKKKDINFQNIESLQQVVNVVNEANEALNNKNRTMRESPISEVLAGALGAGVGAVGSFAALYGLGTVGLSAAGVMSGLAAAGGGASLLVGGAVSASVAGLFVLAAPITILAAGGVGIAAYQKRKQLKLEKERLYQEAIKKQNAIVRALKEESGKDKRRIEYLKSINILLQQAIKDLKNDLKQAV